MKTLKKRCFVNSWLIKANYHWLSENLPSFVNDPHAAVRGLLEQNVLNLVYHSNQATRLASVELCKEKPEQISKVFKSITDSCQPKQDNVQLSIFTEKSLIHGEERTISPSGDCRTMTMPKYHPIPSAKYLNKMLYQLYDRPPDSYQNLLETPGVGPSALRALAMVAEVTHGAAPSFQDPVQRTDLTSSLEVLRKAIAKAKLGENDKLQALKKLAQKEGQLIKQPLTKTIF